MNKKQTNLLIVSVVILFSSCVTQIDKKDNTDFPILKGPYLGQKPPRRTPEIFAPGIVSTELHEHSIPSFSPDGSQILWYSHFLDDFGFPGKVISTNNKNGRWAEPAYFDGIQLDNSSSPFYAPDGQRIFFTSKWEGNDKEINKGGMDIWYIDKVGDGWSDPKNLGIPNTPTHETQATVTNDKTIYFQGEIDAEPNHYGYGIYRSEFVDGKYEKPELLPANINTEYVDWTPFIAPDESYLLFSSHRPGGYGDGDIYVSFRNNDTWTNPINLGPTINGVESQERYPYVSPDGKYLFFASNKLSKELNIKSSQSLNYYKEIMTKPGNSWNDFYWVDASFIDELRPKE